MTIPQANGHQTNGTNVGEVRASIGSKENNYNQIGKYVPRGASGIGVHDFEGLAVLLDYSRGADS